MTNKPEIHLDVVGSLAGHVVQLGHGEVSALVGTPRYRSIASLLHEIAWNFEHAGDAHEAAMRTVQSPIGDKFFEIVEDEFVLAETREAAELEYLKDKSRVSFEWLQQMYPELKVL